jgi:hypothetical protein
MRSLNEVRRATADDADACVSILKESPEHFAAATHPEVARGVTDGGTSWAATDASREVIGFVVVEQRFERAAEILHAAVAPDRRSAGSVTSW